MSLSENRFPLFRDMRLVCACPYRKTGSHFSGTCAWSAHVLIGKPVPTFPGHALAHQPPQPKLLVRPYPRSSWQPLPADAGTVASAAMVKARAKTIFVIVVLLSVLFVRAVPVLTAHSGAGT